MLSEEHFNGVFFYVALVIAALVFGSFIPLIEVTLGYEQSFNDLFYAEAPFGILYTNTEGHSSGSFLWSSSTVTSSLGESYVVKYWQDNMLYSKTLDASSTPIVVDGTFRLEVNSKVVEDVPVCNLFDLHDRTFTKFDGFVLHLPSLPANVSGYDWRSVP